MGIKEQDTGLPEIEGLEDYGPKNKNPREKHIGEREKKNSLSRDIVAILSRAPEKVDEKVAADYFANEAFESTLDVLAERLAEHVTSSLKLKTKEEIVFSGEHKRMLEASLGIFPDGFTIVNVDMEVIDEMYFDAGVLGLAKMFLLNRAEFDRISVIENDIDIFADDIAFL